MEENAPAIIYIPRGDIYGIELIKSGEMDNPYLGQGELYNVKHGSECYEAAAWSYKRPYDEVLEIKNMIAFYPNKVKLIRITG